MGGAGGPWPERASFLVEEFDEELLIYDQQSDQVHCLSSIASAVWRHSDGRTLVEQLAAALKLDRDAVDHALQELDRSGLLESTPPAGLTRREAAARLAKIGAGAAAAPLVYSIAAPSPALAASEAFCEAVGCHQTTTTCSTVGCLLCRMTSCSGGNARGSYCVAVCSVTTCSATKANVLCGQSGCACNPGTGNKICHSGQCGA